MVFAVSVTVLVDSVAVAAALAADTLRKHGAAVHCAELLLIAASRFFAVSVSLVVAVEAVYSRTSLGVDPLRAVTNVYVWPATTTLSWPLPHAGKPVVVPFGGSSTLMVQTAV